MMDAPSVARVIESQVKESGVKRHHWAYLQSLGVADLDALFEELDAEVLASILASSNV